MLEVCLNTCPLYNRVLWNVGLSCGPLVTPLSVFLKKHLPSSNQGNSRTFLFFSQGYSSISHSGAHIPFQISTRGSSTSRHCNNCKVLCYYWFMTLVINDSLLRCIGLGVFYPSWYMFCMCYKAKVMCIYLLIQKVNGWKELSKLFRLGLF